jgi:hypothetical protein
VIVEIMVLGVYLPDRFVIPAVAGNFPATVCGNFADERADFRAP